MAEDFKPITSQDEFDSMIRSRLERERNKIAEQYSDYDALKGQIENSQKQIDDLTKALSDANEQKTNIENQLKEKDSIIGKYEIDSLKTKVANEFGLSYEATQFLAGSNEEEIRKTAESLQSLMGKSAPMPMAAAEPVKVPGDETTDAFKQMTKDLFNN